MGSLLLPGLFFWLRQVWCKESEAVVKGDSYAKFSFYKVHFLMFRPFQNLLIALPHIAPPVCAFFPFFPAQSCLLNLVAQLMYTWEEDMQITCFGSDDICCNACIIAMICPRWFGLLSTFTNLYIFSFSLSVFFLKHVVCILCRIHRQICFPLFSFAFLPPLFYWGG